MAGVGVRNLGAGWEEPCAPCWRVWRPHSISNGESLKVCKLRSEMGRSVFCRSTEEA